MKKTLFQYAVLHHETDVDCEVVNSTIIINPGYILASSENAARDLVIRKLTDEQMEDYDNIEILIRAF